MTKWVNQLFDSFFNTPSLHVASKLTKYRNKITYSLPIESYSDLAEDRINDVCRVVQEWNEYNDRCLREVMVKAVRSGQLLIRVTIQKADNNNDVNRLMKQFCEFMVGKFPEIECLCYNIATSNARPAKDDPIHIITLNKFVLETTPNGLRYQIGPDTFSEVNHEVERLQYEQTICWLEKLQNEVVADPAILIVSGRDISSFGLGFGTLSDKKRKRYMFDRVIAIQHCPLVHQDAMENFKRHEEKVKSTVLHMSKPTMLQGFSNELAKYPCMSVVGVMTGGRKGLDPSYIKYLNQNQNVKCIIYNSCSTKSLIKDMKGFLDGGFIINDFRSFDFFPGTGYTASLSYLIRRPRTLILPVGPAAVGKSMLAKQLVEHCSSVRWWHRDAIFATFRNEGYGLNKTKQLVHADLMKFLHKNDQSIIKLVDSTNGNKDARRLYATESNAQLIIHLIMKVDGEDILEFLLQRSSKRLSDGTDKHPSFPNCIEEQREKHIKILKGINYPEQKEMSPEANEVFVMCSPRCNNDMTHLPYRTFRACSVSQNLLKEVEANSGIHASD